MLTNGEQNFSLLIALNVPKFPEQSFVNTSSGIEHIFALQSWFFDIFHFGCKQVNCLCNSRHWPLITIWRLSHICSAHKKFTRKTECTKDERENCILANINILCIYLKPHLLLVSHTLNFSHVFQNKLDVSVSVKLGLPKCLWSWEIIIQFISFTIDQPVHYEHII